jgi:hypothetical protein
MWICNSILEIILPHTSSARLLRTSSTCAPYYLCTLQSFCTLTLPVLHVQINDNISQQTPPFSLMENLIVELIPLLVCSYGIHSPLLYDPLCHSVCFSPFDINGKGNCPSECAHLRSDSPYWNVVFNSAQFLVFPPPKVGQVFQQPPTCHEELCTLM